MTAGDRVLYLPPGEPVKGRTGTLLAISGVSACVQFDDCAWAQWAPLARLALLCIAVDTDPTPIITLEEP